MVQSDSVSARFRRTQINRPNRLPLLPRALNEVSTLTNTSPKSSTNEYHTPWVQPLDITDLKSRAKTNRSTTHRYTLSPPVTPPAPASPLPSFHPQQRGGFKYLAHTESSHNLTVEDISSTDEILPNLPRAATFSSRSNLVRQESFDFEAQFKRKDSDASSEIIPDPEMEHKVKTQTKHFRRLMARQFPPGKPAPADMITRSQHPGLYYEQRRVGCGLIPLRSRHTPKLPPARLNRLSRIQMNQGGTLSRLGPTIVSEFEKMTRRRHAHPKDPLPSTNEDEEDFEIGLFNRAYFQSEPDLRRPESDQQITPRHLVDLHHRQEDRIDLDPQAEDLELETGDFENVMQDREDDNRVGRNRTPLGIEICIPQKYSSMGNLTRGVRRNADDDVRTELQDVSRRLRAQMPVRRTSELPLDISDLIKKYNEDSSDEAKTVNGDIDKETDAQVMPSSIKKEQSVQKNDQVDNMAKGVEEASRRYASLRAFFEKGSTDKEEDVKGKNKIDVGMGPDLQSVLSSVTPSPSTSRSPEGTDMTGSGNDYDEEQKGINLGEVFESLPSRMDPIVMVTEEEIQKDDMNMKPGEKKRQGRVHFVEESVINVDERRSKDMRRRATESKVVKKESGSDDMKKKKSQRKRAFSFGGRRKTTEESGVIVRRKEDRKGQRVEKVVSELRRKVGSIRNTWSSRDY